MSSKTPPNREWSPREDLLVTVVSPELAAEKLGLAVEAIEARRVALGLSAFVARKHPQGRGVRHEKRANVEAT
jgi:hypothetical protein